MKTQILSIASFCALLGSSLSARAEDPASYFGGSDNEAYLTWSQSVTYNKTTFVSASSSDSLGVALHWTIEDTMIRLAVAAKASGWSAFGIGESGSMLGADIIMFTAETNKLVDSYVRDEEVMPLTDDCQSWTLVDSTIEDGFIIFEASRLLDTGDTQDRAIFNDSNALVPSTRVLAAWGDTAAPTFHGESTARGALRFHGSSSSADEVVAFAEIMEKESEGSFVVQAQDFLIPQEVTTYQYFCYSREDIEIQDVDLDLDLHTIGIEPFIDPRTRELVHHFVVTASSSPWNSSLDCDNEFLAFDSVYIWAPGDVPLNLPSTVGGPLGLNGFQSFRLQIHYDNPKLLPNLTDSSGVRMYYTTKKRQYDLGIHSTGDPNLGLGGGLVSEDPGLSQHVFECEESCSTEYVKEPITVIREFLHMHAIGVSMTNAQIRDGAVVRQAQVEYWDFRQQGNMPVVQEPFEILPGDTFRTICNYDASKNETFGFGSENEMCMAFLYYYPRQVTAIPDIGEIPYMCGVGVGDFLPGCNVSYAPTANFRTLELLDRVFGTAPATCPTVATPRAPVAAPTNSVPTSGAGGGVRPTSPTNSGAAGNNINHMAAMYGIVIASVFGMVLM